MTVWGFLGHLFLLAMFQGLYVIGLIVYLITINKELKKQALKVKR